MQKISALNPRRISTVMAAITLSAVIFCGCSAIVLPRPEDVVRHPLGTESIKVGMTKERVESIWGKPNQVKIVEDQEKWHGTREVWTYYAQYGSIPFDAGYLSNTKRLYFDGNNLTEISD